MHRQKFDRLTWARVRALGAVAAGYPITPRRRRGRHHQRTPSRCGTVSHSTNQAQFSVFPEIGVSVPFDWRLRGVLAVRYNYSLKSGDTPAQEYVGISVGLAWN